MGTVKPSSILEKNLETFNRFSLYKDVLSLIDVTKIDVAKLSTLSGLSSKIDINIINITLHQHKYIIDSEEFFEKNYEKDLYVKKELQGLIEEDYIEDETILSAALEHLKNLNKELSNLRKRVNESLSRIDKMEKAHG